MQQGVHDHLEGAHDTADGSADDHYHLVHGVLDIRRWCALGRGQGTRGQQRGETIMPGCR